MTNLPNLMMSQFSNTKAMDMTFCLACAMSIFNRIRIIFLYYLVSMEVLLLYRFLISTLIFFSIRTLIAHEQIILDYTAQDTIQVTADRQQKFPQSSTIGTKIPITIQNAPNSISVVSNTVNQIQGNQQLDQALTNVSGINIQTGFGVHDYFTVRGFNSLDNGLVLTNGTKEPEVTTHNLYNIEQIEVLKGPSAFLYGGNPLSGTINLVRKRPNYKNFLNFSSSYGSYNTTRATLDAGKEFITQKLSGRLNAIFQQSDLYRNDKAYRMMAINPSISKKLNDQSEINVNFEYIKNEYKSDSGLPLLYNYQTGLLDELAAVNRKTSYQTPFDYSDQEILRLKFNYTKKLGNSWHLSNKLYYTELKWNSTGTLLLGAYPSFDGSYRVNRSLQFLDDKQTIFGNQFEVSTQYDIGKVKNHILMGIDMNQLKDDFSIDVINWLPSINLINPVETYQPAFYSSSPYQYGEAVSNVIAPYIVNLMNFSKQTRLFIGARNDMITFNEHLKNIKNDFNEVSHMFGISQSIGNDFTIYANTSQAFAPPSSRTDGALEPEKSKQIETGLKSQWYNRKIKSIISIYRLDKEDIAIPSQNGFIEQIGTQRSQGIEFEVYAQMTDHCASIFSYAYTETEMINFSENVVIEQDSLGYPITTYIDRSGNEAAFAPKHMVNFWHHRELGSNISIGGAVRYVSAQFIAEDNIYEMDGYITFNASISYELNQIKCFLDLKNITNTKYEMRGFGGYSVIPAMPFHIHGRVEIRL